jgi:uncharacterized RDD family membrane protein YckC
MSKEYYLVEDGEKTGPYTYNQLINMDITIHTEIITPTSDEPQLASELPEFIDYFETKGVYFPTGDNLAPFGSRTFAFILDYLLVSMIVAVITVKAGWVVLPKEPSLTLPYPQSLILVICFSFAFLLYNVLFELSKLKATPGKLLCKIMVVDIDGQNLKFGNSLVKNLGVLVSLMIYALPFLTALISEHRQTWYERITKAYQITRN